MKVIEFDWAVKEGKGRYPKAINRQLVSGENPEWHPSVKPNGFIEKQYDELAAELMVKAKQLPNVATA